jgi:RNA polymerase sigma-70 factor (ECF subfamily)
MAQGSAPSTSGNGQVAAPQESAPAPAKVAPDAEWVRRAVAQYERKLVAYAAHVAGDVERARDVVQETFVRLCGADRRQVEPRLAQWLFTVTRNGALDARRKERRMRLLNDTDTVTAQSPAGLAPDPADAAARDDTFSLVMRRLAELPPAQQEVIRLKFQHGLSYREIGDVLNLTATNVGFLIHTGLKTLRQRLAGGEAGAPANA